MLLRFPPPVIEDGSAKNGSKQQVCYKHKQELRILEGEKELTITANDRREEQSKLGGVTASSCRNKRRTISVIVNRVVLVTVVFLLQFGGLAVHAFSRSNVDQVFGLQLDHRRAGLPSHVRGGGGGGGGQSLRGNPSRKNHAVQEILEINHKDRRRLLSSTTRPLAVKGNRVDPLNHLRHYRNGYDVTNKHYWASVAWTGISGYAIGVAWMLIGLILALLACCTLCCCRRERSKEPHASLYYFIPRLLALLLTLCAIGCLITLFVRNKQLHTEAIRVRNTIVGAATSASNTVHNVSSNLAKVDTVMAKYNIAGLNTLNSTEASLNQQADRITSKVNSNVITFNRLINAVQIALIIILSLGLFIVLAGLDPATVKLPTFLRWRKIFFVIIVLGWMLTVLTWLLFGLFFALNNVALDTCQALTEYLQSPANTTLDSLLPCEDLANASTTFTSARQGIRNIIIEANTTISSIERMSRRYTNGSASIPRLCDPIGGAPDYTYTNTCPAGTIQIGTLSQVLQPYVCPLNTTTRTCLSEGKIVTQTQNTTLYDFSSGAQTLLDLIPAISGLSNCSFVYTTFSTIVTQRCTPVKSALRHIWVPLLLLSIALLFLTLSWILANHRNTQQRFLGTIYAQEYSPKGRPL